MVKQMIASASDLPKYHDTILTLQAVDFGGTISPLSRIPLSSSGAPNQRYGLVTKPKSLEIKWASNVVSAGDLANTLRLVVVRWRGVPESLTTPGNPPQVDDIFEPSATGQATAPLAPFAYYSTYSAAKVMSIVYDTKFSISPGGPGGLTGHATIPLKGDMSFNPYSADPSNGALYLCAISDSGVAPHPNLEFSCRLWFDDVV